MCSMWRDVLNVFSLIIKYSLQKLKPMKPLIVILGATGTGKSKLALEIASKFNGEIISADSMQIYKGLDIVTNKVTKEERAVVKHHMLDFLSPVESYTVVQFRDATLPIISKLHNEGTLPVVVGGTHYYVESVLWNVLVQNTDGFNKSSRIFPSTMSAESISQISNEELCEVSDRGSGNIISDNQQILEKAESVTKSNMQHNSAGNMSVVECDRGESGVINSLHPNVAKCETNQSCSSSENKKSVISGSYGDTGCTSFCQCECDCSCNPSKKFCHEKSPCIESNVVSSELQCLMMHYNTLSNDELLRRLEEIDPEMASQYHPNDRRKVLRSLEVWHQTGVRHSQHLRRQLVEVGGTDLGGSVRYNDAIVLWITCEKEILRRRLDARVDSMLQKGLLQELSDFHATFNVPLMHKTVTGGTTAISSEKSSLTDEIHNHYTKGIFQSIGLKEFHEYLSLNEDQRKTNLGEKLLKQGIEMMKLRTRQYSKKQDSWLKSRFIIRNRARIPVYALNGSDLDKWQENVSGPAMTIVESILQGKKPSVEPFTMNPLPENKAPVPHELLLLLVNCRIDCKVLLLTYKAIQSHGPVSLRNALSPLVGSRKLRSSAKNLLYTVHSHSVGHFDCAFSIYAPRHWKTLPRFLFLKLGLRCICSSWLIENIKSFAVDLCFAWSLPQKSMLQDDYYYNCYY